LWYVLSDGAVNSSSSACGQSAIFDVEE
jgi:hypothetical protein